MYCKPAVSGEEPGIAQQLPCERPAVDRNSSGVHDGKQNDQGDQDAPDDAYGTEQNSTAAHSERRPYCQRKAKASVTRPEPEKMAMVL